MRCGHYTRDSRGRWSPAPSRPRAAARPGPARPGPKRPEAAPRSGLDVLDDYGACVLIVLVIWGGFAAMMGAA